MGSITRFKRKTQYTEIQKVVFKLRKYCSSLPYLADAADLNIDKLSRIITGEYEPMETEKIVLKGLLNKLKKMKPEERNLYIFQRVFGRNGYQFNFVNDGVNHA